MSKFYVQIWLSCFMLILWSLLFVFLLWFFSFCFMCSHMYLVLSCSGTLLGKQYKEIRIVMKRIFWSKYRILLLLLGMTATLYILFLYYSMSKLDAVNSNSFLLETRNMKVAALQDEMQEIPEILIVSRVQSSGLYSKVKIRGVMLDKMHLYFPTKNNTFQCLHSKVSILNSCKYQETLLTHMDHFF